MDKIEIGGLMMGFCEHGNNFLSFMKTGDFLVKRVTSLLNREEVCVSVRNMSSFRGKFWQKILGKDSLEF
jgi:hypothetical protein